MKKIIIIGAGPAGLAAADKLCDYKFAPIVLEKNSAVGGLSRTLKYKEYYFDIGPHRFFTKNKAVLHWWQDILKDDFIKISRYTRIYYKGKFFNYPLSIGNVLANLGIGSSFPIVCSYCKSRLFPSRDESSFENWVTNRFGNRLYRIFFKDYTEKLWGIPCGQISADWAAQRIKGLSFTAAVKNALMSGKHNKIKTLVKEFYYPRLGAGMMYEAAAERIKHKKGVIHLNTEVTEILHENNKVTGIVFKDSENGKRVCMEGTDFCSSMPLTSLVSLMKPSPDENVLKHCKRLMYRSILVVYIILNRSDLFKDNWIYIHSRDIKVGRIQNFKNWSRDMLPDVARTSLALEYFCSEGDSLWRQSDEQIISLAGKELEKLNFARPEDIEDAFVLRVPKAYPRYDSQYHISLGVIKDFVSGFANLQCIGRYGMFRYNNMDHSVLTGFLAAENIRGAKKDLWNVNVERSYHEELEENNPIK